MLNECVPGSTSQGWLRLTTNSGLLIFGEDFLSGAGGALRTGRTQTRRGSQKRNFHLGLGSGPYPDRQHWRKHLLPSGWAQCVIRLSPQGALVAWVSLPLGP